MNTAALNTTALLIPATTALLDGWRGPVLVADPAWRPASVWGRSPDPDLPGCWLTWAPYLGLQNWQTDSIRLDLSRVECRDRVGRIQGWGPCVSARLHANVSSIHFYWNGRLAALSTKPTGPKPRPGHRAPLWVRALSDLDPVDDAQLPDGSRLVDALALAAICQRKDAS